MKTTSSLLILLLGIGLGLGTLFLVSYTNEPTTTEVKSTVADSEAPKVHALQRVEAPQLPQTLDFAGESVPLQQFDMHERLDRELLSICYWHSSTLYSLKLAHRYFPIIEPILARYGVPEDFKYLAVTESNLQNVVSPANAKGIWQFIKGTAEGYNLEVNREIDERYDIEKATEAACKYLKEAYNDFGSWTAAAASYNMGRGGLRKRMNEQFSTNYYDLYLNSETSRYVPRILAYKILMEQPEQYGFFLDKDDYYTDLQSKVQSITVSTSVDDWRSFAKTHQTSYRLFKILNPWIRSHSLKNSSGKTYNVLIAKG